MMSEHLLPVSAVFFYPQGFRMANYIYLSLTLILNILMTSLIIGRLIYCKNKMLRLMEDAEVSHYTFLSMMFIESAAPNVMCSISMIISMAAKASFFQIGYAVSPAVQVSGRLGTSLSSFFLLCIRHHTNTMQRVELTLSDL